MDITPIPIPFPITYKIYDLQVIFICASKKYLLHSGMFKPNHPTLPTLVYTGKHQCAPLSPEGETLD